MTPPRTCPFGPVLLALSLAPACSDATDPPADESTTSDTTSPDPTTTTDESTAPTTTTTAAPELPPCSDPTITLDLTTPRSFTISPGGACEATLTLTAPHIVAVTASAGTLTVDAVPEDEPGWHRPRELHPGPHTVTVTNPDLNPQPVTLTLTDLGPTPPPLLRERSLVWTQPALVDAPESCRLACVLSKISPDAHGGALLRQWFDRFATTLHSERLGPRNLLDEFAAQSGPDPTQWNINDLPFTVTAIHNRLDLRTSTTCGELRISLASVHPIFRPFHLIFLFAQRPVPEDISPSGALHCAATALRWARLGDLPEPAFIAAAMTLIAEHFTLKNFLAVETNEFMIAPWEWRQWFLVDPATLDNRPLFQTVDTPRLNTAGPDRDAFLAWAEANAEAINHRTLEIPATFRAASARANQGTPWVPLQLTPALDAAWPDLRRNLEIVGCPACHATDAEFVQTLPNRTFSPYYAKELDARADYFAGIYTGAAAPPPFGPLQPDPALPP